MANHGDRTIRRVRGQVTWTDSTDQSHELDIEIDYLGEHAAQLVYIVMQQDPRTISVHAEAHSYQLE